MAEDKKVQPDPITTKSYSVHLLVSMLLLMASLVWAVYDEVEVMRPYKDYQARFRAYYQGFLMNLRPEQAAKEEAIRNSTEYQALNAELNTAEGVVLDRIADLDKRTGRGVIPRMTAARNAFQVLRSEIDALRYQVEVSGDEDDKTGIREDIEEIRARVVEVELPLADGSGRSRGARAAVRAARGGIPRDAGSASRAAGRAHGEARGRRTAFARSVTL